jgi:hypothetical protein
LAVDTERPVRHGLGMSDSAATRVTGLIPAVVRIELQSGQREPLIREVAARIETIGRSLPGDGADCGGVSVDALAEHAAELAECAAALDALQAPTSSCPVAGTVITFSTPVADALVRACAARAVDELEHRVAARDGEIAVLRQAAAAVVAWSATLAELRELDETAPDGLG